MNYWLMKSEPSTFSIEDLQNSPRKTTDWEGVRNYQARNFMRQMKRGDKAFFYHSSCSDPGIMGIMEIVEEAHPDLTAQNPESSYYDPKSTKDNPRWFMVKVCLNRKFKEIVPLSLLKTLAPLHDMILLRRGNRLSITPVSPTEWKTILKYSGES